MQAKASKIYRNFANLYMIIKKIYISVKIVADNQHPLAGEECGDTPDPNTCWNHHLLDGMIVHKKKNGGSHPRGQSLLRYQTDCL